MSTGGCGVYNASGGGEIDDRCEAGWIRAWEDLVTRFGTIRLSTVVCATCPELRCLVVRDLCAHEASWIDNSKVSFRYTVS